MNGWKNGMNGWKLLPPGQGSSKFKKYQKRLVVILSGKKNPYLYMSPATFDAMGKPKQVSIMTRGSNIGLVAELEEGVGYKVQCQKDGDTPYISVSSLQKLFQLNLGVYEVHMEAGGVAVFDSQDTPSSL